MAARRTAQRGPGQSGALTREQIVDAADRLARQHGLDQVTVRRLSAELSVTPAALYWHLDSKDHLVSEVVDRALANVRLPGPEEGAWLERLLLHYASVRQELLEYPGISAAMLTLPPSERILSMCVYTVDLLTEGGFDEDAAMTVFNAVSTFSTGHLVTVERTYAAGRRLGRDMISSGASELRSIIPDRPEYQPFMRALADFDDAKSRQAFLDGIELLVRGAAASG